jgi:CheY-like chemotaxis protein
LELKIKAEIIQKHFLNFSCLEHFAAQRIFTSGGFGWAPDGGTMMALRQPKVLIADDSNTVHQLIRDSLPPDYSANVSQAYDGAVCLRALERGVDLAFIDVHMPTMGGMDALWAARIAGNKTFVTLMSGQADRRCIDLARRLEAYEFLAKPFGSADIEVILATHRRVTARMQVLLVDDSPVSVKVMRKVLDNSIFHLNIDHANTGREALERCDASPFDVVFLDVNMPGLNGYATLPRLMQANRRTKVVMISGERDALRERQALRLGAAAVMHKPFFPTEIDAVLHRIMGLQSPKLATGGYVRDFGIKIHGRTISVEHVDSGHMYEYVWFREPPYLRLPLIRENKSATIPVGDLVANAKIAAVLELENASLLQLGRAA